MLQTLRINSENWKTKKNKVWFDRLLESISPTLLYPLQMHQHVAFGEKNVPFSFTNRILPNSASAQNKRLYPTFTPYALCCIPKKEHTNTVSKTAHKMLVKLTHERLAWPLYFGNFKILAQN